MKRAKPIQRKAAARRSAQARPRKRGRPTDYAPALARSICEGIAAGKPLLAICEADHMPDRVTVWRWHQRTRWRRNAW
jgi:hypothetical protein